MYVIVDLITVTIFNNTSFFKVSNKHFKYIIEIWQAIGQITFGIYTVIACNFFVVTIH